MSSSSVESRIVTMKFDNGLFERAASATMRTLEMLKMAITGLPNSTKGLSTLASATKNFSMGSMVHEVEHVSAAFVGLATVGITALANITNRAVDAGIQLGKSLTIGPIGAGFSEYELKMGSIQTILSNTAKFGTKLPEVMKNLNQLNTYADKTIYSFGDMTKNIGLFTNAGIKIGDATMMIRGFSNVAAASGTNAQGAASAAYQLSQALSAGTIRLMDWRSLQNVGMGNANMKDGLLDIANAMGTVAKSGTTSAEIQKNFNGSLEKGWLSADVMSKYLRIMAGDMTNAQMKTLGLSDSQIKMFNINQKNAEEAATKVRTLSQLMGTIRESIGSSWATTFELIFGNFKTATVLFTNLNNTIGGAFTKMGDARNKVLKQWNKLGGRDLLIDSLSNAFNALLRILKPIHNAFRDIFPPHTGKDLYNLTKSLHDFTENLSISKSAMKNIRSIFDGVFSVISIGVEVFKGLVHYFASFVGLILSGLMPASKGVLDFGGSIGDMLVNLKEWLVDGGKIKGFFDTIINGRAKLLGPLFKAIGEAIRWAFSTAADGINWLMDHISVLTPYVKTISEYIQNLVDIVKSWFGLQVGAGMTWISDHKDDFQRWADSAKEFVSSGFDKVLEWLAQIKPFAQDVWDLAKALAELAGSGIANLASNLGPMLSGLGGSVKQGLGGIAGAAGGLMGKIDLGSMFDFGGDATTKAVSGISKVGGELKKAASIGDKVKAAWDGVVNAIKSVGNFLAPAVHAIGGMFGAIGDKVKDLVKGLDFQDVLALINTGLFLMVYRMSTKFLGSLSGLANSAGKTLDALTGNLKTMQQGVKAKAILDIAIALGILAAAAFVLSKIDADKLGFALGAIAVLLAQIVMALKLISAGQSAKGAIEILILAVALDAISVAVLALAGAVAILGRMKASELTKGITAVGLILAVVIGAAKLLDKSGGASQVLIAAFAIGVLAFALSTLAAALKLYSSIDTSTLIDGGIKAAAVIVGLGLSMRAFGSGSLAGSAAMLIASGALVVLAGALKVMGSMSWGDIGKAMVVLGGSMLILALGLDAMSGSIVGAAALVITAGALAVFVPVLAALGSMDWGTILKGLGALALIFATLGIAGLLLAPVTPFIALLAASVMMLGIGMAAAGAGMMLFGTGLTLVAAAGTAAFAVLTGGISAFLSMLPLWVQQFGLGFQAMAVVIRKVGPQMVAALGVVMRALINQIRKSVPAFGRLLQTMIHTGLRIIRNTAPDFIQTAFFVLDAFLRALRGRVPKIVPIAIAIVVAFIRAVGQRSQKLAEAGVKLIIKLINAMTKSINAHSDEMGRAGGKLGLAIVHGIGTALVNGLSFIGEKARQLAQHAIDAAKGALHINSPSRKFIEIGMGVNEGFAMGLDRHSHLTRDAATRMANGALETVRVSMSKLGDELPNHLEMRPTVNPVLDLSQLQKEATRIGRMFGGHTIKTDVSLRQAKDISSDHAAAYLANLGNGSTEETVREIKYEQNNYSPKALSPVEVYRNTRNLLNLTKRELNPKT